MALDTHSSYCSPTMMWGEFLFCLIIQMTPLERKIQTIIDDVPWWAQQKLDQINDIGSSSFNIYCPSKGRTQRHSKSTSHCGYGVKSVNACFCPVGSLQLHQSLFFSRRIHNVKEFLPKEKCQRNFDILMTVDGKCLEFNDLKNFKWSLEMLIIMICLAF